jgi:hypothetical protein
MRGQWWIPVIAIVLGTGLAIAIDRLPGGGGTNDVKLDLSQQSPTSAPADEETTTTVFEDTTTTAFLDPAAFATEPASSGGTRTATTRRTTTATTRRASTGTCGGGTGGGSTATTPATAPPNTATTASGSPGSDEWCRQQPVGSPGYQWCNGGDVDDGPNTTRTTRRTSTTAPDDGF